MKDVSVLRAQVVQVIKSGQLARLPLLDIVEQIKERYKFHSVPSPQELLQPIQNTPSTFTFGKFRENTIETFQVLDLANVGTVLAVICRTSTSHAEQFLADVFDCVDNTSRIDRSSIWPVLFQSNLEVVMEASVASKLASFQPVAQVVSNLLKRYGIQAQYEPVGVSLHFDTAVQKQPLPAPFVFERRTGAPYSENRYYSQAPLKTEDHKALLEQVEKMIR